MANGTTAPYTGLPMISGDPAAVIMQDLLRISANQEGNDKLFGLRQVQVKVWARTSITLNGLAQGLGLLAEDFALVTAQSNAAENGVWIAKGGAWVRHPLFASGAKLTNILLSVADADHTMLSVAGTVGAGMVVKEVGKTNEAIVWWVDGAVSSGAHLLVAPPYRIDVPASMNNSRAICETAPSATTTISVQKNSVEVGVITFAAASKVGTFSGSAFTLLTTDTFKFVCASPNGMGGLSVSLFGLK